MADDKINASVEGARDAIIKNLATLVRIPSRTGAEGKAQEYVASQYRGLGLDLDVWEPDVKELFDKYPDVAQYPSHWEHDLILPYQDLPTFDAWMASGKADLLNYRDRPNVVGIWKGSGGGRSLILNSHIDTVTVEPASDWHCDPFGAESRDGLMYGRGTSDCKGGIIAAIEAVRCLQRLGIRPRGDVILESVVNEEHAGNGTLACIAKGYVADAVISGEPSDNQIRVGSCGGVYWGIGLTGHVLHTKGRWEGDILKGVSAIEKLPVVINALLETEAEQNSMPVSDIYRGMKPFSVTMGRVWGGSYDTASAAACTLRGSVYFGPDAGSVGKVMGQIKKHVAESAERDPWLREHPPEVFFYHHDDAHWMDPGVEIVEVIQKAGEPVLGRKPPVVPGMAANDCRHQANQGKMAAVVFGPGTGSQAHTSNESIRIDDLIHNIKVLAAAICQWSQ
jgi:acetylornithine deacetylase